MWNSETNLLYFILIYSTWTNSLSLFLSLHFTPVPPPVSHWWYVSILSLSSPSSSFSSWNQTPLLSPLWRCPPPPFLQRHSQGCNLVILTFSVCVARYCIWDSISAPFFDVVTNFVCVPTVLNRRGIFGLTWIRSQLHIVAVLQNLDAHTLTRSHTKRLLGCLISLCNLKSSEW